MLGMPEPVGAMDVNLNGRFTRDEAIEATSMRFVLDQLAKTFMQNRKSRKQREWHRQDTSDQRPRPESARGPSSRPLVISAG